MMRKTVVFILLLMLLPVSAQRHALQLGGHVGIAMWRSDGPMSQTPGLKGGLDISYRYLARVDQRIWLGPKIGLAVAYSSSALSLYDYEEQYTNVDYYKEHMDYTITSPNYREQQSHLQVEIPLMMAIQTTYGLTMGLGVKAMMPISSRRSLRIASPNVETYYPDFEVWIHNELVTGKITDEAAHSGPGIVPHINAMVSGEIGYEWGFPYHSGTMGVQAYLDLGVWSNYRNDPTRSRLVDIAPILNESYPVPEIKTNYLTDTYSTTLNYLSVGVRLYYTFTYEPAPCYPCRLRWY